MADGMITEAQWHEKRKYAVTTAVRKQESVKAVVTVSILNVKGLKGGSSKSSFVCECQLVGRPYSRVRTPAANRAVWNYEGLVDSCVRDDALEFTIFQEENGASGTCMGQATMDNVYDQQKGSTNGEVTLFDETGRALSATLNIKLDVTPVPIDSTPDDRIFISLTDAENLVSPENVAVAEWYIVFEIPGKPESKVRSRVVSSSEPKPVWHELHELDGYASGDRLQISIIDGRARQSRAEPLGSVILQSSIFHDSGFEGIVPVLGKGASMALHLAIDRGEPAKNPNKHLDLQKLVFPLADEDVMDEASSSSSPRSKSIHSLRRQETIKPSVAIPTRAPGPDGVSPSDKEPVPFKLRNLENGRSHRLAAYTLIGRSRNHLDENIDLVLNSPGICDVSRVHACIKAWPSVDGQTWSVHVYTQAPTMGTGLYPTMDGGRSRSNGGTFVDGEPVDEVNGTRLKPGCVLRFGVNELWVLDNAPLHQRSRAAQIAARHVELNENTDPSFVRDLKVPSFSCDAALHRCQDWISIVRVVLEACNEPDEPPCVDCIEVSDEAGRLASRHEAQTVEEQQAYPVERILCDVRLGTTIRLHLSSDPLLIAPVLQQLADIKQKVDELYRSRAMVLG